jgi:hypothetical protein
MAWLKPCPFKAGRFSTMMVRAMMVRKVDGEGK